MTDVVTPLSDLRIVAIEQYGAGPFGSLQLADLGAEVIKIEDPRVGGDIARYVAPVAEDGDSLFFESFNRNKRSIALDLTTSAGRAVFDDLVRVSDAVYSNLRGDVPAKIGITYASLGAINPRIVCCSLSGFGMTGPRAAEPAYDYVLQAAAGWMDLTGEPNGPPTKSGLSVVDFAGGLVAAIAILAGVHAARRDRRGMDCDLSLFDTAMSMLNYVAAWQLNGNHTVVRTHHSAHPSLVPFQAFPAADRWIVVACAKEKFFRLLAGVIGRPELADDPRFADFAGRRVHSDLLVSLMEEAFAARPAAEWLHALREAGIPSAQVNTLSEALSDPQTIARELILSTEHPRFGIVREVASAVRVGDVRLDHRRAPRYGEDSEYVLREVLGYSDSRVHELTRSSGKSAGEAEERVHAEA